MARSFRKEITIDVISVGAGVVWGNATIFPEGVAGVVTGLTVRVSAAPGAGPADLYLATNGELLSAVPAVEDYVVKAAAVPLTVSATAASLDTGFDFPPRFKRGLTLAAAVTTVAGTYTLVWVVSGETDS
jgi:hypothetical protein